MSQDPEEPPIVFRQVTPEQFCAAYHRAVAEGGDLETTTWAMSRERATDGR
jgi:hypothetical protein